MQVALVLYALAVLLLPGYVLLKKASNLRELEVVSLAPIVSIVLYGAVFYPAHVIFGTAVSFGHILLILVFFAVCWAMWGLKPDKKGVPYFLIALFVLSLALRLVMVQYEPVPRVGDGELHFLLAKSFLYDDWFSFGVMANFWSGQGFPYHPAYRPPLYNFVLSLIMSFSETYAAAQITTAVLASIMVAPAYLICERFAGRKYAVLATIIVLFNSFLVDISLFPFPRILLMYLSLVLVFFYLKGNHKENWAWLAIVSALGMLTHYSFAILAAAICAHYFFYGKEKLPLKETILLAAVFAAIVFPWLFRNQLLFGNPLYSESRYMRFADGWGDYTRLEPPDSGYLLSKGYPYILERKLGALLNTFIMVAGNARDLLFHGKFSVSDLLFRLTLPGNSLFWVLTPALFPFALIAIFRRDAPARITGIYLLFGLAAGLFFSWLDMPAGFMSEFFSPIVPLMLALGVREAGALKKHSRKILTIVIFVAFLQTFYVFWFNHFSTSEKGYNYPKTIAFASSGALEWMRQNTGQDDIVMSNYVLDIAYYTGRRSVVIPNEDGTRIAATAEKYRVDYILVDKSDEPKYPLLFTTYSKKLDDGSLVIYGKA